MSSFGLSYGNDKSKRPALSVGRDMELRALEILLDQFHIVWKKKNKQTFPVIFFLCLLCLVKYPRPPNDFLHCCKKQLNTLFNQYALTVWFSSFQNLLVWMQICRVKSHDNRWDKTVSRNTHWIMLWEFPIRCFPKDHSSLSQLQWKKCVPSVFFYIDN